MDFLLAWHNLIFFLPILVGLVAASALALGFGGEAGEGDADGVDTGDVEIDTSIDMDADSAEHMELSDGSSDHESDGHIDHNAFQQALSLLGVGKVPLSIVIMLMGLSFGITGIILNALSGTLTRGYTVTSALISMIAAFVTMIVITGGTARAVAKIIPSFETRVASRTDLIGRSATLVLPANTQTGFAHVRDEFGRLHEVRCRTTGGEISEGSEVFIFDYDTDESMYLVESVSPFMKKIVAVQKGGADESADTQSTAQQNRIAE